MDQNEFQENHLLATMKCLEEFEKLTQNYQDLNMDYENLLVNDLKGLHSNYYLINYDKKSSSISEMIYSIIQKRFDFSVKEKNVKQNQTKSSKNKALSFFNLILLLSFFIIDFSFKIATFFYKLIFNFDFNYKFIIELITSTFKSSANNAAMIFYDWRLFFCIDTILKKILW